MEIVYVSPLGNLDNSDENVDTDLWGAAYSKRELGGVISCFKRPAKCHLKPL